MNKLVSILLISCLCLAVFDDLNIRVITTGKAVFELNLDSEDVDDSADFEVEVNGRPSLHLHPIMFSVLANSLVGINSNLIGRTHFSGPDIPPDLMVS